MFSAISSLWCASNSHIICLMININTTGTGLNFTNLSYNKILVTFFFYINEYWLKAFVGITYLLLTYLFCYNNFQNKTSHGDTQSAKQRFFIAKHIRSWLSCIKLINDIHELNNIEFQWSRPYLATSLWNER